ncbi:MAG: hypothetical protein CML05_08410 [Pseudozobellia sp.]|nr:hypothetical protein [Pseudozobellia sp.]|tara:strand:+ start:967 stop:2988 length:2022 start_codon:yes stop_codon:yes gene_type:complete
MEQRKNPFHELYVTESISSDKFVHLFSPFLIEKSLAIFQPGHVILKGLPGAGKSMLLSLLKPSIREAYAKKNVEFPVPKEFNKFIGAGINLKRSGVSDFGQRPLNSEDGYNLSPFYFADYLNYWLVLDILESILKLSRPELNLSKELGINCDDQLLNDFAIKLGRDVCWNGYLEKVNSFEELKNRLVERIGIYRNFLNYNIDEIPEDVQSSKTSIGIPIAFCANCLRDVGIIQEGTEIYVRIDQYEELAWLEQPLQNQEQGELYQQLIHKLLGMRDNSVSYKLGTRHFAWQDNGKMFGTSAQLEKRRNYIEVGIDSVLKRKENRRTWIFPDFAEDILRRRIEMSNLTCKGKNNKVIDSVFGNSGRPTDKARDYLKTNRLKALKFDPDWPKDWREFLMTLASENPFSAKLAESWVRQKGKVKQDLVYNPPTTASYPWENKNWWKKERTEQALLQIASRNRQQINWYGKQDILSLSGGNILAFLSISRHIWDVWIRDTKNIRDPKTLSKIDKQIQSIGIIEASSSWYEDLSSEKGGKERKLFIHFLGSFFYKTLVEDIAMSNPGHNGFSLSIDDFEKNTDIKSFLNDATDYGDLYDAEHTSKLSDKRKRRKWYLNPILSPHFRIPSVHTKEPMYVTCKRVRKWINDSTNGGAEQFKLGSDGTQDGLRSGQISLDL